METAVCKCHQKTVAQLQGPGGSTDGIIQVLWLLGPYALFTLAFGGSLVPKLNLYVRMSSCQAYLD